jgi:hypothetical protein
MGRDVVRVLTALLTPSAARDYPLKTAESHSYKLSGRQYRFNDELAESRRLRLGHAAPPARFRPVP